MVGGLVFVALVFHMGIYWSGLECVFLGLAYQPCSRIRCFSASLLLLFYLFLLRSGHFLWEFLDVWGWGEW